jgi:hypothetical protein
MSETALRQALVAAIAASIIGVVALAGGAFIAPMPVGGDATLVVTGYLIRSILVIVGLTIALIISYFAGYRIEAAETQPADTPTPDPSANSRIVSLLSTPGSRRDAFFGGGVVMLSYWLVTTLYILALGKYIGDGVVNATTAGSFVFSHGIQGLVFIAAGLGLGALGARAAVARKLTSAALNAPSITAFMAQTQTSAPVDAPPPPTLPGSASTDPATAPQD